MNTHTSTNTHTYTQMNTYTHNGYNELANPSQNVGFAAQRDAAGNLCQTALE